MSLFAMVMASGENQTLPVAAPVLLTQKSANVVQASLTSDAISPADDSTLYFVWRTRDGSSTAHLSPVTSGLTNVSAWALVSDGTTSADLQKAKTTNDVFIHTTVWQAKVTGAAGTGTVQGRAAATVFQEELEIYSVANAGACRQVTFATADETATFTNVIASFALLPKTDSLVMAATTVSTGSSTNRVPTTGFTEDTDAHTSSMGWETQHKLGSAPQDIETTGIPTLITRSMIAWEVQSLG